jgi:NitT/TauT family transport system substrate-binding protein
MVLEFIKTSGIAMKPVATGGTAATLTQVMSRQVDVGWSSPPFALDAIEEGKINIVARGSDLESMRNQSPRTVIANADLAKTKPDLIARFMQAYRETIDWMYESDEALQAYATFASTTLPQARRIRDEFFPKPTLQTDEIKGLSAIIEDAVTYKYLTTPLTAEQQRELVQIPAPKS